MTIKYKVIERGQPGVVGGGDKKFYASTVSFGELTLNKLTRRIAQNSTVSGADIRAVLFSMVEVMQDALEEGSIVRLGSLGSLRVSISSNGEASEKEVNSHSIRSARTLFAPGKALKTMLNNLEYEKTDSD